MEVIEITRQIMEYLGVFKGSKPVLHDSEAMIIKGMTHDRLESGKLTDKLEELFNHMNIKKVELSSKKAEDLTNRVDQKLRKVADVFDQSEGIAGLEKLKKSYLMTGFEAEYMIGQYDEDTVVYVVMWMDGSGFGPMFAEAMVLHLDPEE